MPALAEIAHVQYDPHAHGRNVESVKLLNSDLLTRSLPARELSQRIKQSLGFERPKPQHASRVRAKRQSRQSNRSS